MKPVIQIENLSKSYILRHENRERYRALRDVISSGARNILKGKSGRTMPAEEEFWALKDVSFSLGQGERVGIIGRNGAGKSTLLKILSRITEPSTGLIKIRGRVASLLEVGTGFHPELTGSENIFLNGAILGMSRQEIRRKFDEIVSFAEVERFLDTPVKRYSSGMYVRLAFAVAAHLEPEILVIDEVLAVGDAQFQKKCLGKMEDVSRNEGRTVIFVSHNMGVVAQLCQSAIVLDKGSIGYQGNTEGAIDYYLGQGRPQNAYESPDDRKEFYVASADVFDEHGQPCHHFLTTDRMTIRFRVKKKVCNPHVMFSCTIQNRNGDYLSTFVERMEDYFGKEEGEHEFVVRYPANLLAPNSYAFRLALFLPNGKTFDLVEMICPVTVVDEGSPMAAYEGSSYGYFPSNHEFRLLS